MTDRRSRSIFYLIDLYISFIKIKISIKKILGCGWVATTILRRRGDSSKISTCHFTGTGNNKENLRNLLAEAPGQSRNL